MWDAAVHKYTEDLGELKKELLKAVDEGAETDTDVFEEKEEEVVEQPVQEEEEGDWKAHIKGQMEEAEEKPVRKPNESTMKNPLLRRISPMTMNI